MPEPTIDRPCVGACDQAMAPDGVVFCIGCGRPVEAIAAWGELPKSAKRVVLEEAAWRLQQHRS